MAGQSSDGDLRVLADVTRALSRGDITTADLQALLNRPKPAQVREAFWSAEELLSLFTEQAERLDCLNYRRSSKSESLKRKLAELRIPKRPSHAGYIPFVIVMAENIMVEGCQINYLTHRSQNGRSYLTDSRIRRIDSPIPSSPYLIVDVEDGRGRLGKSANESEAEIKEEDRLPLVPVEAIALEMHAPFLRHHSMELAGARYKDRSNGDMRIGLSLYEGQPVLSKYEHPAEVDRVKWGTGSCKQRITTF